MSTAYSSIEEAWGVTNLEAPTAGIVPKKIPIPRTKPKTKRVITKPKSVSKNVTAAGQSTAYAARPATAAGQPVGSVGRSVGQASPVYNPQCSVSTIRAMVYDAYVNGGPHAVLDMLGPDVTKDIFGVYTSENDWNLGMVRHWVEDIPNDPNKIALVIAIIVLALLMFR